MDEVTETLTRTPARIEIDLNGVTADGTIRTRQANADRPVALGEDVLVYEPEDQVAARAVVAEIDNTLGFIYLAVDWQSLRDDEIAPAPVLRIVGGSRPVSARTRSSWSNPMRLRQTTRSTPHRYTVAPTEPRRLDVVAARTSSGAVAVRAMKGVELR